MQSKRQVEQVETFVQYLSELPARDRIELRSLMLVKLSRRSPAGAPAPAQRRWVYLALDPGPLVIGGE